MSLLDLVGDPALDERHRNGRFVTLRLTSRMYHRFHAPYDARIKKVTFIVGDVWNINPIALKRIERLFCKNERAVLRDASVGGEGADAGAGRRDARRQHPPAFPRSRRQRAEPGAGWNFPATPNVGKGDGLGWFEHGSTIIVPAPDRFEFCENITEGTRVRASEPCCGNRGLNLDFAAVVSYMSIAISQTPGSKMVRTPVQAAGRIVLRREQRR